MSPLSNIVDAASGTSRPPLPLRLGIVLSSSQVPGWIYYLIDKLTICSAIDPLFFVLKSDSWGPASSDRHPVLFGLWATVDHWVRYPKTDALRLRDLRLLLESRSIPVFLLQARSTAHLSDDDIARLKAANLDLLLCLGNSTPGVGLSACASLGVWSVQDGATAIPGQFWDMLVGHPVTRYGPQVIEQTHGRTKIVYRSSVPTNLLSLALNQNAAYWDIAQVLATKLSDAERARVGVQLSPEPNESQPAPSRTLSNMRMARFLVQWAKQTLRNEFTKRLFHEQWSIGIEVKHDIPRKTSAHRFRLVRPSRDRFYADPFLVERNGRNYLFFEDYRFSSQKGLISCCELDAEGNCSKPRVVLERKYHLSYPFLFHWQGEIYMIPETRANSTIEMYRASDFPYSWTHETVLMSGVAATDSTLLHHGDKWWLFTAGVLDHVSLDQTLCLFFANSPLGPWTAHPKNPIVSDICRARPAGCLYFDNGQLIRPGQDCSKGYGYAVQLHQVDVLSETDYQETPLARITPDWIPGSSGIHTINQNVEYRVLDCKFLISRFSFTLFPFSQREEAEFKSSFELESAKSSR